MEQRTWSWHSPQLGRTMEVARFGHFGKPVLLFPTAGGDFLECERFLMIRVLAPLIEAGRIKVYSCGSIANDGWLDSSARPWHKSWLQARFDAFVQEELLPHIERDCGGYRGFVATGASLGAYNSVNVACKHPEWFDLVIAMSGTYEFDRWMGDHRDENYYFNMPIRFLPHLGEGPLLQRLRDVRFVLATGTGRHEAPDETWRLAETMRARGIHVDAEFWGRDAHHDWPTWRTMLPMFLDRLV